MTNRQSILVTSILFIGINSIVLLFFQNISSEKMLSALLLWKADSPQQKSISREGMFLVKRVIDGDTIELDNGEKVRYIGINTPESVDPRRMVQCFGKEAGAYNKTLVEGRKVRLVRDISDRDKYGRLLRFVYLEDGTFVNEVLVREGYAVASTYPPDIAQQAVFSEAESQARNEKRGLWSVSTCDGKK